MFMTAQFEMATSIRQNTENTERTENKHRKDRKESVCVVIKDHPYKQ